MGPRFHSPKCGPDWTPDALVLSAGGMFAAWQAGAWKSLSEWCRPRIVVGCSAGALNGWAIAGGCPAGELIEHWLGPDAALRLRSTWPLPGMIDGGRLRESVRRLHQRYSPRVEFGAVAVRLPWLKPRLFRTPGVASRHLLASCAIPAALPPVRIGRSWYVDGGLISALPLWAAVEMGARRILALNALPLMPSRVLRWLVQGVRTVAGVPRQPSAEIVVLSPSEPLGSFRDLLVWDERNARRWIELGQRDAKTISIPECSERQ